MRTAVVSPRRVWSDTAGPGCGTRACLRVRAPTPVTAGSPAVAARLRQFEPSLVAGLRARGWLVGRIRFRPIAVHDVPRPPPVTVKEPVSSAVLQELETLEATGMNADLKAALSSFVRRQKSYLES